MSWRALFSVASHHVKSCGKVQVVNAIGLINVDGNTHWTYDYADDYLIDALTKCRGWQAEGRRYGVEIHTTNDVSICLYTDNGLIFWQYFLL